jgi:ribose-phosphate pyrophosphokinase
MSPVLFPLPGNERMAAALADGLKGMGGRIDVRRFPDGDSYVRIDTTVSDRTVILVCTLDRPDEKFLQLSLVAATARDLGAAQVGLVCPYLPYMRQDARFRPGEAISSRYFAHLLEVSFDWLVTVDPHLHRIHSLNQLFALPAAAVHAAPYLADWIRNNVENPLLIGPDSESEQWVGSVAARAQAAYTILEKVRRGDRDVEMSMPNIGDAAGRTPVLVDDIISTGRTMVAAIRHLQALGWSSAPVCVGVHAIFADDAYGALRKAGAHDIITTNTILHPSNRIDLHESIVNSVRSMIA